MCEEPGSKGEKIYDHGAQGVSCSIKVAVGMRVKRLR